MEYCINNLAHECAYTNIRFLPIVTTRLNKVSGYCNIFNMPSTHIVLLHHSLYPTRRRPLGSYRLLPALGSFVSAYGAARESRAGAYPCFNMGIRLWRQIKRLNDDE